MPFVKLQMPALQTPLGHEGAPVTPGEADLTVPTERPSWSDTFSASFEKENLVGSYFASEFKNAPDYYDPVFGDAFQWIKGTKYEPYADQFTEVRNFEQGRAKMRDIDREEQNVRTINASGWRGFVSDMVAGTIDLPSLLPGGVLVRGARGGIAVGKSALMGAVSVGTATGLQELALHESQNIRTTEESAFAIGGSMLIGGLLGGGLAHLLSPADQIRMGRAIDKQIDETTDEAAIAVNTQIPPPGQAGAAGAAAVVPPAKEMQAIAGRAAGFIGRATRWLNPNLDGLNSPSPVMRQAITQIAEQSLYQRGNWEGMASPQAAETFIKQWNAGLGEAARFNNQAFFEYSRMPVPQGAEKLTRQRFYEEVGKAMRNEDQHAVQQVAAAASTWRSQVIDPMTKAAIDLGLLPPDVKVETAPSYFSRVWNIPRLVADEGRGVPGRGVFFERVVPYLSEQLRERFIGDTAKKNTRLARLVQEREDLQLSPEERLKALDAIEQEREQLDVQAGNLIEKTEILRQTRSDRRKAKEAGNTAEVERLKALEAQIRQDGGEPLQAYIDATRILNERRRNVNLGFAGQEQRTERIIDQLASLDRANLRNLNSLIIRGQKVEREIQKIAPEHLKEQLTALQDRFTKLANKYDLEEERILKRSQEAGEEQAPARKAHLESIVDAAAQTQRKRSEALTDLANRIGAIDEFDRPAAIQAIRDINARALALANDRIIKRADRAAILQRRLSEQDPQIIVRRLADIDQTTKDVEKGFYDTWEVKNLGEDVDLNNPETASFREMATQITQDVYDQLIGRNYETSLRPEGITVNIRGPMKDRTFNVPDALFEGTGFLEDNVENVMRSFVRKMASDIELARVDRAHGGTGRPDLQAVVDAIQKDYARLRQEAAERGASERQMIRLDKRSQADIKTIKDVRDLRRGTYPTASNQSWATISRNARHFNYIRNMGGVVVSSFTDPVLVAMRQGLLPFMGFTGQLATNLPAIRMAVREAQLAGLVLERILPERMATLTDIANPFARRGPIESFLESGSNLASKWNGIRIWTDGMAALASTLVQNRVLKGVGNYRGIKDAERAYLHFLGIDEGMAERIQAQFSLHGQNLDGIRVASTEKWTDPQAQRAYRAAIAKDTDSMIIRRSVGDVPIFANTATGAMILQFRGFMLAAHQKIMLRGLQESQARMLGTVAALTGMGMAITYLKAVAGNHLDTMPDMERNPGWWIGEGIDRAGIMPVFMELANASEKLLGFNPVKGPLKRGLGDEQNQISQKLRVQNLASVLGGPSIGMVQDVLGALAIPGTAELEREEPSAARVNAAKRLLPYNSYPGMQQFLRYFAFPPNR